MLSNVTQTFYLFLTISVFSVYLQLVFYTIKLDKKLQIKKEQKQHQNQVNLSLQKSSLPTVELMKNLTQIIDSESYKTRLALFETEQFQYFYKKFKHQQDTIIKRLFGFDWNIPKFDKNRDKLVVRRFPDVICMSQNRLFMRILN